VLMPRTYSMVRNNVARYLKLCEEESTITGRVGDLWSPDHEIGALSFLCSTICFRNDEAYNKLIVMLTQKQTANDELAKRVKKVNTENDALYK